MICLNHPMEIALMSVIDINEEDNQHMRYALPRVNISFAGQNKPVSNIE